MRNINARVPGLVSFLELITDGRAPDVLSGQVQGAVDLERYIAYAKAERWRFDFDAPAGIGDYRADLGPLGGLTTVPATEAWVVTAYSLRVTLPNGRDASVVPTFWLPAVGSTVGVQPWIVGDIGSSSEVNIGGLSTKQLVSFAKAVPWIVPPTTAFGYSVLDWSGSGGGVAVVANLEFYRLRL